MTQISVKLPIWSRVKLPGAENRSSGQITGMELPGILARVERLLDERKLSASRASTLAGKPDAIRNLKRAVQSGSRRGISTETVGALAQVLGVSASYLMTGDEAPVESRHPSIDIKQGILEVDVRAGAGGGGIPVEYWEADGFGNNVLAEGIKAEWSLPTEVLGQLLKAKPEHLKIFEVVGDSMEPRLFEGDRVFVDTRYKTPTPEGIFALWDGEGIVIKRVQVVRGSEPRRLKVISVNTSYDAYMPLLEEVQIIGRYAGRFTTF